MNAKRKKSLGRPRSSEQKQPTNVIILQTATALFLKNGFQDVSIDDVAKECNVTKATVYYYFESKASLFTEAMVQMMLRIRKYMEAMLVENEPLRIRLHKVAEAHLKATFDLDLDGFLRETKNSLTKKQFQQIQEAEEKMFDVLEKAFHNAIETGEIPKVNPKFAAHSYISLLKVGNYRNPDQTAIFSSIEETAEKIIDFFWNGLAAY
ncbi:TetR/AcrR family transcriptional regulator [Bacillus taeanensis]|uniref:TetR/AcrR family transcriptional regulator n=1 Tax=Bacillus taeanensis TaxID=273032 RepID=UPI0015F049D7|nr:TetR/AcrR family transcriptional regulator [Bacillus taeanensis]